MAKNRHHYVPKLYLRHFSSSSSGEDIINMYHLKHSFAKRDVGMKGQCYRWKFYGETDELEDRLAEYENQIAPLLRQIISKSRLPEGATEKRRLYHFIALIFLRNPGQVGRVSEMWRNMRSLVQPRASKYGQELPDDSDVEVRFLLSLWQLIANFIFDMSIRLLVNRTKVGFITSDNPGIKYNQYCEKIKGIGVYGYLSSGLQIFLPISPYHMIVLSEKTVYRVAGRGSPNISTQISQDIDHLNMLQAINAEERLLFADWSQVPHIESVQHRAARFRRMNRTRVVEAVADDDPEHTSLIHAFDTNLNIRLDLSFMEIRKEARKLPIEDRAILYRETNPAGAETNQKRREGSGGVTRRFSVKKPNDK